MEAGSAPTSSRALRLIGHRSQWQVGCVPVPGTCLPVPCLAGLLSAFLPWLPPCFHFGHQYFPCKHQFSTFTWKQIFFFKKWKPIYPLSLFDFLLCILFSIRTSGWPFLFLIGRWLADHSNPTAHLSPRKFINSPHELRLHFPFSRNNCKLYGRGSALSRRPFLTSTGRPAAGDSSPGQVSIN